MKPEDFIAIKKLINRVDHAKNAGSREVRFSTDEADAMVRDVTRILTLIAEEAQYNIHLQRMLQHAQQIVQHSTSSGKDAGSF